MMPRRTRMPQETRTRHRREQHQDHAVCEAYKQGFSVAFMGSCAILAIWCNPGAIAARKWL